MNNWIRAAIVGGLVIAVVLILANKTAMHPEQTTTAGGKAVSTTEQRVAAKGDSDASLAVAPTAAAPDQIKTPQPRILELGADRCMPCRMMMPILEELKRDYGDQLAVDFIDVWQNPEEGRKYRVQLIPVQIFLDPQGKELFRHEGFYPKAEILAKWKELGYELTAKQHARTQ